MRKWQCRPRGVGENSSFPEHHLHGACSFLARSQGYSSVNRVSLGPIQICLLWQRQKGKTSTVAVALGFARLSFSWKQTSLWWTPFYCTAVQTVRVVSHCVYWQLLYILKQQILAVSWFQIVLALSIAVMSIMEMFLFWHLTKKLLPIWKQYL